MGTQPNRKLAKRKGSGRRPRKLIKDIDKAISKKDYKTASSKVRQAGIKIGGKSVVASGIVAAIIAYNAYKKAEGKKTPKQISSESITKIPSNLKKNLTVDGKDSIRSALTYALSKTKR